jgi:hypothetical protein
MMMANLITLGWAIVPGTVLASETALSAAMTYRYIKLKKLPLTQDAVLRSRIIFMRLRLRVKILMRLWLRLLPYCIARQKF